ncbi:glutamic acid-rich protein-like [Clytia hemisphaerica]|uniref:glutamic acid-rich protein-like n=1 Tax=Clytia hemisphaerica TaxID=252671 RepID=UPI0034D578B6
MCSKVLKNTYIFTTLIYIDHLCCLCQKWNFAKFSKQKEIRICFCILGQKWKNVIVNGGNNRMHNYRKVRMYYVRRYDVIKTKDGASKPKQQIESKKINFYSQSSDNNMECFQRLSDLSTINNEDAENLGIRINVPNYIVENYKQKQQQPSEKQQQEKKRKTTKRKTQKEETNTEMIKSMQKSLSKAKIILDKEKKKPTKPKAKKQKFMELLREDEVDQEETTDFDKICTSPPKRYAPNFSTISMTHKTKHTTPNTLTPSTSTQSKPAPSIKKPKTIKESHPSTIESEDSDSAAESESEIEFEEEHDLGEFKSWSDRSSTLNFINLYQEFYPKFHSGRY